MIEKLAVICAGVLFACNSMAQDFLYNRMKFRITSDSTCEYRTCYEGCLGIPKEAKYKRKKYKVTSIGEYAFYKSRLQLLIIPNTIERIEKYAFVETNLTNLKFGKNVKYIDEYAFVGNQKLKEITIEGKKTKFSTIMFYLNGIEYATIACDSLMPDKKNENLTIVNGIPYTVKLKAVHLKSDKKMVLGRDTIKEDVLRPDVERMCPVYDYDAFGYGCFWNKGATQMRIYVPMELLDEYKKDEAWREYKFLFGE